MTFPAPIGGEMLNWSDLDGTHGPAPAGDPVLRPLLAAATGRTLVAGPHDPALIDALAASDITLLVRGLADAEALAARYANRAGVEVLCGSLEKLAATPAYETVVALDGLDRLRSAEADDRTWGETLTELLALLRPGGRLLLSVPNLFGVDRLVALPPDPADTDWVTPDDLSRPAGRTQVLAHLADAGLQLVRDYAAYPSALLSPAILARPDLTGYLSAALTTGAVTAAAKTAGAVTAGAVPGGLVAADPVRLITGALRHGLAAELAPSWVLLATRGPGNVPPEAWPDAVIAGREIRLAADDLPSGPTLQELLFASAQRRDLPRVRELLSRWQSSPQAGVPADQVVVADDGGLTGLAPSGEPLPALRAFAAATIAAGHAHLWPAPATEPELTALLAGMTGRELNPADVPAAPLSPADPLSPAVPAVRELLIDRDRLTRELSEARAKHDFYEQQIARRDAELKRVRQINKVLAATIPGRAAYTLVGGLRAGKRAMRAAVNRTRGD